MRRNTFRYVDQAWKKVFSLIAMLTIILLISVAGFSEETPLNATEIFLDVPADAAIENNGDVVYFKFTPSLTLCYEFFSSGDSDTYASLYDAEMKMLSSNDESGENNNFLISYRLNAGEDYYYAVKFYSSEVSGSFPVTITCNYGAVEGYITDADSGIALEGAKVFLDSIMTKTDSSGFYHFDVLPQTSSLRIVKEGYAVLEFSDVTSERGQAVTQNAALLKYNPVDATELVLDVPMDTIIEKSGEYVYYKFTPSVTRVYKFLSEGDNDTFAYLFDANMVPVASNDDYDGNHNFCITQELIQGVQYCFAVRGYADTFAGSFQVSITYDKYGVIEGYVKDQRTNAPLENVHVNYGDNQTYTDDSGYYRIETFVGTSDLVFTKTDYDSYRIDGVECLEDTTTRNDVILSKYIPVDAQEITLNTLTEAAISNDGSSYFRFTPAENKTYYFYSVAKAYTEVFLYDSYMSLISSPVRSDGNVSVCSYRLDEGNQYYFKITANSACSFCAYITDMERGVVVGSVKDAGTGSALESVSVAYGQHLSKTDSSGFYFLIVPPGTEILTFSKEGYISSKSFGVEAESDKTAIYDAVLSSTLNKDQYRVILTWGSTPADLDSHLEGPDFHVYYDSKTGPNAMLDVDDTTSYGPETTTFTAEQGKTYYFYVHDYTNKDYPGSSALATSGAKVQVYNGDSQIAEVSVPSQSGIYWNVFTIRNGTFRITNLVGSDRVNSSVQSYPVESGQYVICVVDEDGHPLQGANVTFDGETKQSDMYGNATFDAFTLEMPIITVEKDGYLAWTNKDSSWEKSSSRFETVILYPESVGNLKLSSARYSNYENMSLSTELLTTTKKISLGNDAFLTGDLDFGKFYISCCAKDTSEVVSYQLWQGRIMVAESTNGFFALNSDSFAKGGDCFIRTLASTGSKVDTAINLVFTKEEINEETAIDLKGDSFSFVVGDEVPFLGGSTFDLDFPVKIPLTLYRSANKMKVGFNLNIAGGDSVEEQIEDVKKLFSDVRRVNGLNLGKLTGPQSRKFQSLIKDTNEWKFFKGGELNFLGYAEGDWGSSTISGALMIQGKVDPVSFDFNTWCVVVPVTVQVKFSIDGSASFEVSYHLDTATLEGDLGVTFSPSLNAFGGVGVSKLVGVGAYGNATVDGDFDILPTLSVNSIDLTGELGVKAYLALFTYEKPFAYNTWHLYTGLTARDVDPSGDSVSDSENADLYRQLKSGLYDASLYKKADLSYLNEEKDYMGSAETITLVSRDGQEDTHTSFEALIQNTYRNAQPVMVSTDDAIYAAFLRADSATGRVYTVVSKFDGTGWLPAVETGLNGTLDNMPTLLADHSGNIWLAYAQTNDGYDGNSMLDYAQNQSIVIGIIDPETLSFTQHQVYGGAGYAHMQELSLVNGVPTLVWVSSEIDNDNDVLWPEQNTIYQATYNGVTWNSATAVNSVDHVITELAVGEENGNLTIACVTDQDNASETEDKQLIKITDNSIQTVVAAGVSGIAYECIPGTENPAFVWVENGVLKSMNGDEVSLENVTGEYHIRDNCIYYSIPTEHGAELCVTKYENGAWSVPITLTEGEGYLENVCIAQLNGHDYVLGMYTSVSISDEGINDSKDLVWTTVTAVSDIKIADCYYDSAVLVPGETVPVTIELINGGDHVVTSVDVFANDVYLSTEELTLELGQTTLLTVPVICPDSLVTKTVSVVETNRTDYHPEDNIATFKMGYPDLCVQLECRQVGSTTTVLGFVENKGIGIASGKLAFVTMTGDVLSEKSISNLPPNDGVVIAYDVDWDSIEGNNFDIRAVLESDGEELYDYNNSDSMHLTYFGHRKNTSPDVVLPAMITVINDETFAGSGLKTVKLQEGVTEIGSRAFKDCDRLEQIEIPASVQFISDDAFEGVTGFVIFCPSGSYAEEYAAAHSITCASE